MNDKLEFLWIDDEGQRRTSADNFRKKTDSVVFFYDVSKQDLAKKIGELLEKHNPDLVIVDHKLDKTIGILRTPLKATGATATELIKDSYPQLPVVCVTKVDLENEITFSQQSTYDYMLNAAHLTHQYDILVSIAKGFKKIRVDPPRNINMLLELLNCPKDDNIRLTQVLPKNIKTGFALKGYASVLWKWISNIFFQRPGFLYDSLWAATLIGAREKSFMAAQEDIKSTKYNGIFANGVDNRWWTTKILQLLYDSDFAKETGEHDIRKIGRMVLKIPTQGYSKCELSGNSLPDTVAFTDQTNKKRIQVCIENTEEHPDFQKLLFFEDMRIIKEEV